MSVNALFAVSLPVTPTHLSGKTASGASMFALIASLAFAAPSIQAVAAGYAEVCSTNLADADCNRLIVTGTSPDEQEMLKLDCGSTNLARCETAWTKVLTVIGNRPEGMIGFVPEPAPKPTAIPVESKGGHIGPPVPPPPPVVEEDPCARIGGFKPKRGTGVIGSVRGKDGRSASARHQAGEGHGGLLQQPPRPSRSSRPASPARRTTPASAPTCRDRGDVVNR